MVTWCETCMRIIGNSLDIMVNDKPIVSLQRQSRPFRLVNSNIHWKKLTLSWWRESCARVCERATRWCAESFITPTISFNLAAVSSFSLSVISSLLFLDLLVGVGTWGTGILVGVSLLEFELLSWPRSSASSSEECSVDVLDVPLRDALCPCL